MHPDLEKLIQLQQTEVQIKNYSDRIEQLPKHLAALEEKLGGTLQSLNGSQNRLTKLALEKRKLEGIILDLEQKNSKYREQLVDVKTNEQYKALLHEIEFNSNQIRKTEDEILTKMEEEEKLRRELQQIEQLLQKERANIHSEKKTAEAEVEQDKSILGELQNVRQSLIDSVAPGVLETYNRIARFRKGVALARATGDSCQACHVRIRPQVLSQIMSGESIVTCDSCHRILYWKPDGPYEVLS
jgi:predicted  nucleic acid-binding Zn-ribbon protein